MLIEPRTRRRARLIVQIARPSVVSHRPAGVPQPGRAARPTVKGLDVTSAVPERTALQADPVVVVAEAGLAVTNKFNVAAQN